METASPFSEDYANARRRICDAASRFGCEVNSHPIGEKGPRGEELAVDVIVAPGLRTDRTLLLSSGIHGVEGFLGSAIQVALLESWISRKQPLPVRCVLLHALNPFGFAWRRRVNEANVDLNRNLLLEGEAFAGSPAGYRELDALLNPPRPPSAWEPAKLKIMFTIARHGLPALKRAVASGQYDFPKGLFFGGAGPSRLSGILDAHFDGWIGDSRHVMHLDFHTGLGDWANCKLLVDHPLDETGRRRLGDWFGPGSFEHVHDEGVAYLARGTFGSWCVSRRRQCDYLYAAAEYGTCKPVQVLAALRAENQAHHYGRAGDAVVERAKCRLQEVFCPRSEDWRRQVLEHGLRLVDQAMSGLAGAKDG